MSEGIKLPTKRLAPKDENPRMMILFGKPKQGKTTLLSMLENNLIIDINDGSDYIEAMAVKAKNLADLRNIRQAVIEAGKPYRFISIDTVTDLEEMSKELALSMYRQVPMGKNFGMNSQTGEYDNVDILTLSNGAGYLWLRLAFEKIVASFKGLSDYLILVGHTKDKNIMKDGKELSENSLDLSGKLERLTVAKADAVGYFYRDGSKNYLNFQGGGDSIVEARPKHLRNQNILIGESDDDGNITSYWDKVYKPQ